MNSDFQLLALIAIIAITVNAQEKVNVVVKYKQDVTLDCSNLDNAFLYKSSVNSEGNQVICFQFGVNNFIFGLNFIL